MNEYNRFYRGSGRNYSISATSAHIKSANKIQISPSPQKKVPQISDLRSFSSFLTFFVGAAWSRPLMFLLTGGRGWNEEAQRGVAVSLLYDAAVVFCKHQLHRQYWPQNYWGQAIGVILGIIHPHFIRRYKSNHTLSCNFHDIHGFFNFFDFYF